MNKSESNFYLARKLRWSLMFILIFIISYDYILDQKIIMLVPTLLAGLLWGIEIVRGNHTEDAMLKEMNDEDNPLK